MFCIGVFNTERNSQSAPKHLKYSTNIIKYVFFVYVGRICWTYMLDVFPKRFSVTNILDLPGPHHLYG